MDHEVTTTEYLWEDLVNRVDKNREKQLALGEIVYEFGGRVLKRERPDPYEAHREDFP